MPRDPYSWADQYSGNAANLLSQSRAHEMQGLLALFAEEGARQRPYVTMPANLAQAEYDRQNAEPYNIRAEQRRYANAKALIGDRAAAKGGTATGGATTDEEGNEVLTIDGVTYTIPKAKPSE
jgi:hypothetical protein